MKFSFEVAKLNPFDWITIKKRFHWHLEFYKWGVCWEFGIWSKYFVLHLYRDDKVCMKR